MLLDPPALFPYQKWRMGELLLAGVVATLILSVLLSKVSYSGAWDGDPAFRNRLAMEAVNTFVAEWNAGRNPLLAFLQTFHRFPTVVHESMLALFILLLNGVRPIDFDTVVVYAAWFSTIWTLIGVLVLYWILRLFSTRCMALLALPICVLAGYILLYANFPRQNMTSHVLGWGALAVYFYSRTLLHRLPISRAVLIGLLFGLSVPTHYSSTYLAFVFVALEVVLAIVQRTGIKSLTLNLWWIFSTSLLVWLLIDTYYYLMVWLHPSIKLFGGVSLSSSDYGFFSGMLYTSSRLIGEAAAHKLEYPVWWFMPGFLYRNFGLIGSALFYLGLMALLLKVTIALRHQSQTTWELTLLMATTTIVVSAIISLGYFQNARKLMVFYPAWCVAILLGLEFCVESFQFMMKKCSGAQLGYSCNARLSAISRSFVIWGPIGIVLVLHGWTYWPYARDIHHARREVGYVREYLATHGINRLLVQSSTPDFTMRFAPQQSILGKTAVKDLNSYKWVLFNRLYRGQSLDLMRRLRNIKPVAVFKTQNALPIIWYEFPLRKSFVDFDDPLTQNRSLYHWSEVREALEI